MSKIRMQSILLMALAAALWSTGGLLIKLIDWHPMAIASLRSMVSGIVILAYMRRNNRKSGGWFGVFLPNRTNVFGGMAYMGLMVCYVLANKFTTAANTIVLQFTSPIWVMLFTVMILKRSIRKEEILSTGILFAGILLFFMDAMEPGHLAGNIIAIGAGISMAMMVMLMKHDPKVHPIELILVGNMLTALLGVGFVFSQQFSIQTIGLIVLMGLFQNGLPNIFFTKAMVHSSAIDGVLIPVLEPILNPLWVFLLQGETIGSHALLGAVVIISAVLFHTISEARQQRKSSAA